MAARRTHALMYHDVFSDDPDESGFPGPFSARYKLPWPEFREHLDAIGRAVPQAPEVAEAGLAGGESRHSWTLTFDDGGASMLDVAAELTRRGWRGHFFVTTARIGEPGFLDAAGVRELARLGHAVGSHSASHPERMSSLSNERLLEEWKTSVDALSELLGEQIRTASVPGGYYSSRVAAAAAAAGITALCTSEPVRRMGQVRGCLVVGRLSVRRSTPARDVAAAAAGRASPWLRQYAGWNLRKPVKALLGDRYRQLRARLQPAAGRASGGA
jgi:peptidoglycan/xylan/chitin deacetylase (PgdA/CDA1 family)